MKIKNKKIGIWGFGLVGQSAAHYLNNKECSLSILDQCAPDQKKSDWISNHNIHQYKSTHIKSFLRNNNYIVPSPGINLYDYSKYHKKWLTELDLFYNAWKKPIIAISGSVGKTTVTHIISQFLKQTGKRVAVAGNIGVPMLNFLEKQNAYDLAVLEVSSFQLEHCKYFAPDLAIITNLYPNHLDRHLTVQNYFNAKYKMITHQNDRLHRALLPLKLACKVSPAHRKKNALHFFHPTPPSEKLLKDLPAHSKLFYLDKGSIVVQKKEQKRVLASCSQFPTITFEENWLISCATLNLIGQTIAPTIPQVELPEHRLEKVATIKGITFYNDSKSTTPASTLAAVEKLASKPIRLLLGGLSKGINRKDLIKKLHGKVKQVYCFGKEAKKLEMMCLRENIACKRFSTLEETFVACSTSAESGDQILLSPAGASFDLFRDYKERGEKFKELVSKL